MPVYATPTKEGCPDGLTPGQPYEIYGFDGGCGILVDDKSRLRSFSETELSTWGISTDGKAAEPVPPEPVVLVPVDDANPGG